MVCADSVCTRGCSITKFPAVCPSSLPSAKAFLFPDFASRPVCTSAKAGEELVEDIAQEMGVTTEEVLEAMEVLGLSAIQLLDPENMKQLLVVFSVLLCTVSVLTVSSFTVAFFASDVMETPADGDGYPGRRPDF